MSPKFALAALAPALLVLAGCGKVGALDQPAPLWGEKAKAEYRAQKAAEAADKAAAKDEGQPEPLAPDTPPPPSPAQRGPDTLRNAPGQGMRPLPDAPGPPGAQPDPFTGPR
jgi:hypothetical protein